METDGEGKFVSLFQSCSWRYIALQNESGFRRSRVPGKGKGNYLTSVAKQAKTAFLHGPTV